MSDRRHPFGLYVLFLVEMWERFSFYCMAAIFVYYMKSPKNGHPYLQENASLINGYYLGLVYFTPFVGGILADRYIGYRWAVLLGAVTMGLGHVFLGIDDLWFFFAGLAGLIAGNGLFKPNISTLVGKLYPEGDPRLDSAYTIFYMGINVGAFLSPLCAGYLRVRYGYHVAFGAAGVGMGISLVLFAALQRYLVFDRGPTKNSEGADAPPVPADAQRLRHLSLVVIFVIVAAFWMAFKQNSNTLALWFESFTDRTPPGWLPASWVVPGVKGLDADGEEVWLVEGSPLVDEAGNIAKEFASSINPFFVIVFSPLMVLLWNSLRKSGRDPSTPAKIGFAMLLCAGAFTVMYLAAPTVGLPAKPSDPFVVPSNQLASPWFLIGAYAVLTLSELSLSPIGLSLVSRLAAPSQRSMWMGGWFAATSVGGLLSGVIGDQWGRVQPGTFFLMLVGSSLAAFVMLCLCYPLLRRAMATLPSKT